MSSKRNKTIKITSKELKRFNSFLSLPLKITKSKLANKIFLANIDEDLQKIKANTFDLIIADPPYNIGKDFGTGKIKLTPEDYNNWCKKWIKQCARILKPTGSIYICIDWRHSSIIEKHLNTFFVLRNRITWKREKGRGAKSNWKNNMEDIWYATKSDQFTFNLEPVKIKKEVIAPYVDKKGKAKDWHEENGKKFRWTHPSNIWTDLIVPFWSMPENTEHPTQKPEKLIKRIILASSNKNDFIFDPFMGSGTTAVVSKKLDRTYCGFEKDKKFYTLINKRLKTIDTDQNDC